MAEKFRQNGFSLVELMVSLAILAILAGAFAPDLRALRAGQQLRLAAGRLQQDLQWARATAASTGVPLEVDASTSSDCPTPAWRVHDEAGATRRCLTLSAFTNAFGKTQLPAMPQALRFSPLGGANADMTYRFIHPDIPDVRTVEVTLGGRIAEIS